MKDAKNDKKIESIFAITEIRRYIADVIDENIKEFNISINELEWSFAFLETYKKFKIGEDKETDETQNHRPTQICNYIISNSTKSTFSFLRELFIGIDILEKEGIITKSEEFIGEMFTWMLDPARSYATKNARNKMAEDIDYILDKYERSLKYSNKFKRYIFRDNSLVLDKKVRLQTDILIKKIDILKKIPEGSRTVFFVNDDYNNEYTFGRKKRWDAFYDVVNGSYPEMSKKDSDNIATYFNSDKRNPLYANYGFKISKILSYEDGKLIISRDVKVKIIGKKELYNLKKS